MSDLDQKLKEEIIKIPDEFYKEGELDLSELCKKLSIDVFNVNLKNDNLSGVLVKEGDEWKIFLNKTDSPKRKRFTVAHELGHFFSYKHGLKSKCLLDKDNQIQDFAIFHRPEIANLDHDQKSAEKEANQFAAEILMPKEKVDKLINGDGMNVEEMANYFGVSESSMTFRLVNLGYHLLEQINE